MYIYTYIYIHAYTHAHTHACTHVHTCTHIYLLTCVYTYAHFYTCARVFIYTYEHTRATYMHIRMYIYTRHVHMYCRNLHVWVGFARAACAVHGALSGSPVHFGIGMHSLVSRRGRSQRNPLCMWGKLVLAKFAIAARGVHCAIDSLFCLHKVAVGPRRRGHAQIGEAIVPTRSCACAMQAPRWRRKQRQARRCPGGGPPRQK